MLIGPLAKAEPSAKQPRSSYITKEETVTRSLVRKEITISYCPITVIDSPYNQLNMK